MPGRLVLLTLAWQAGQAHVVQGVWLIHLAPGARRHRPGPNLVAPIVVVATAEQQDLAVALVDRHAREGGNPTGGLSHGRCGTNL